VTRYTVQPGDTLAEIAHRFNTTVAGIVQLNNITNPDLIYPGQVLLIDEGVTGGRQQPGPVAGQPYNTAYIDGLLYTIFTDKRTYQRRRDSVRITLVKCNVSPGTITLRYNTGQRFDFATFRDGREVWRWSDNQFFTQAAGTEVLRPGECRTYTATWDLRNKQGNYVAIDAFQIRGYNVARNLRNRYVPINIRVERPAPPLPEEECPEGNLLRDPGIERWSDRNNPIVWDGYNLYRTTLAHSGRYAGELGAVHNRRAVLSQTVDVSPGRLYRVTFWARENVQPRKVANFEVEVEILLYNRRGGLIGRVDPIFTPRNIPNNRYYKYSFTTALLPEGAERADIRFLFKPGSNNDNTVKIDDVTFECIR